MTAVWLGRAGPLQDRRRHKKTRDSMSRAFRARKAVRESALADFHLSLDFLPQADVEFA